jgi:hypothetical protein
MHTTARITENVVDKNKYVVTMGPRNPYTSHCQSFKEAYITACDMVNWEYEYITIDILPIELRNTIYKIREEHEKISLEGRVAKTYSDYLDAKKALENSEGE